MQSMETKIESLLEKVKPIVDKNKRIRAEKEKNGEFFNIFSILNVERDEVHTHSAFLAELLNPKGSHGQGDMFLKSFLETVVHKNGLNTENAEVNTEYYIGPISEDKKQGGKIDILIRLYKPDHFILIENKIDAGDQETQLERYHNHVNEQNFTILYLTKDGHEPSEWSTGKETDLHYWDCISYSQDIWKWINECSSIEQCPKNVQESIKQYLSLITKITGKEDANMEKNLTELMLTNFEETITIRDNMLNFQNALWKKFKEQVNILASDMNCTITEGYWNIWVNNRFLRFTPRNHERFHICFGKVAGDRSFYWLEKDEINMEQQQLECMQGNASNDYPYGWTYICDEYQSWGDTIVLKAINDDTLVEYIKNCLTAIINELNRRNWDL